MPAIMPETAHETEVAATRSATSGMLVDRSRAMSNRNGARVVPLEEAANMASPPASSSAHGMGGNRVGLAGASGRGVVAVMLTVTERLSRFSAARH